MLNIENILKQLRESYPISRHFQRGELSLTIRYDQQGKEKTARQIHNTYESYGTVIL
jgi:hypothetical protein